MRRNRRGNRAFLTRAVVGSARQEGEPMNLERINAGEYTVRDGEREVKLTKGLNRKWTVKPGEGIKGEPSRVVASYTEAKTVAEAIIRRAGEAGAKSGTVVSKRAEAALKVADPDTLRLKLAEQLHKLADDILVN